MIQMITYVVDFRKIGKDDSEIVGGKGAKLGELSRIAGITVPDGFCITTAAYKEVTENSTKFNSLLDYLSNLKSENKKEIFDTCAKIRNVIEEITIPTAIERDIIANIGRLGDRTSFAIRSSATAEDLLDASFAGQQDTYLNIYGKEEILKHISKCWASLYTDRAVIYRLQNGFGNRNTYLSVVIQKMIFPEVSGILFTADPITGNRKILSIDASFGLGEALVSGLVSADNYKVCEGQIIDKKIGSKKLIVAPAKKGGTEEREIKVSLQNVQTLTDEKIIELERLARKIENNFGHPQDIEWCMINNEFYFVQSRPITTLFPIPEADDMENHVYVSVGHQQMMTDAMKPLGLSFFLLTTPAPMRTAAGRLFVDISNMMATSAGRQKLLDTLGKSDPLTNDALRTILKRNDFIRISPADSQIKNNDIKPRTTVSELSPIDPAIIPGLINKSQASIEELKRNIENKSGAPLADFILEDIQHLKQILFDPQSHQIIMAAIEASSWINEKMYEWLGEKNAADTLSQSVSNNITSEMGLALLDVADSIRPYPEVIEYLALTKNENFTDELIYLKGGQESLSAITDFLEKYGMRCAGEIDITKSRWSEKPITIIATILNNIKNAVHGESRRKFENGHKEALKKEQELLERLRYLIDGEQKVQETRRQIDILRSFIGYREYPKYGLISRYFVYKQALLKEAEHLQSANIIYDKEDIFYLTLQELRELFLTQNIDYLTINKRKRELQTYKKLSPPRVITSDGEIISGEYELENLPSGALAGYAVSSGVVEGRARVIFNIEDADLANGDILVTTFTDPSWTPLFVSIKALVTEVGGLMTHGAVIAREYGLPAVVGVEFATKLIKDGQQIRVNGTDGFIEILQ